MALATNDQVALTNNGSAAEPLSLRGNVLFGVLISNAAPWDVLWENGEVASGVPSTVLDKIDSGAPPEGAVKYEFSDLSPAYAGFIVRSYTRQPGGSGAATAYSLLRAEDGVNYEVLATELEAIQG